MLFAAVNAGLLAATSSPLVHRTRETMLASSALICALQFLRGLWLGSDLYSAFIASLLSVLLTPFIFVVLVVFGAPVLTLQVETALLSLFLAVLALQPLLLRYNLDPQTWLQIISFRLRNSLVAGSLGTCIGAWIGAVPLALDWDRDWQAYPITIVLGAYAGGLLGTVGGGIWGPPVGVYVDEQKTKVRGSKLPRAVKSRAKA